MNYVEKIDQPRLGRELCLGNSMIPIATIGNIGGGTSVRAQMLITNAATGTRIYGDTVNATGIAAGATKAVNFKSFVTNLNNPTHAGRMNVTVIATTMINGVVTPDSEPLDDTVRTTMFVLRRLTRPFIDPSNDYVALGQIAVPDPLKWVTANATVVEGDVSTFDPPSPRDPVNGYGKLKLKSPVIKLDRLDHSGVIPHSVENSGGNIAGDTLTSFPINLQNATSAILSFDYHRSTKQMYPWSYDKNTMIGAEAAVLNTNGTTNRAGDSLIIEFKKPAEEGCSPSADGWTQVAAIDGGKDFEFQRFSLPIESKNKNGLNYFTLDFRFRIRLKAKSDVPSNNNTLKEDEDAWYLDNIRIESPSGGRETEVNWVRVVSPYTKVPASQAIFPVYVKFTNIASTDKTTVPLVVQIDGPDGKPKYFQRMDVTRPAVGKDTIIQFPNWDARNTMVTLGRECKVKAFIPYSNYDVFEGDNNASSSFFLNAEEDVSQYHAFAYDDAGIYPQRLDGNDWASVMNRRGSGVGFNNNTGSFAMRFKLMAKDTLYGVQAYFCEGNAANDAIRISVHEGSDSSNVPGALVNIPGVTASFTDERKGANFEQFWPYYFPSRIVLPGVTDSTDGVYWIVLSQLSLDNMMLGADISRSGFDLRVKDALYPDARLIHRSPYATQFSATQNAGRINNVFAYEVTAGTGNWKPFVPDSNRLASEGTFAWTGNYHYIPMMRVLVGRQSRLLPVEYARPLEARDQGNAALLTWTTATESNPHGYIVQRRVGNDEWQRIGFVLSYTPYSSTPKSYSFVDEGLSAGTYTYRLAQRDLDGAESISGIAEVTISGEQLANFSPNPYDPAVGVTAVSIDASMGEVDVAVINSLGQTVRTFKASDRITWNGKDDRGNVVASGTYLIRLQSTGINEIRRITVVK